MKNAIIYVFSGTGNTKKACDIYKSEFEKNGVETTLYTVKKGFENLPCCFVNRFLRDFKKFSK